MYAVSPSCPPAPVSRPRGADPRRARYYSALLDASLLPKGEPYEGLPNSYVVFVVDGDALEAGGSLCHFERREVGSGAPLGDGSHIVYVDASYNHGDTVLGDVMHDFLCADPAQMRRPALADRARYLKETEEGAKLMGNIVDEFLEKRRAEAEAEGLARGIEQGFQQGIQQGLEQGREQGLEQGREQGHAEGLAEGLAEGRETAQHEIIVRMLADGSFAPEKIAVVLNVPVSLVEEIAASS